MCSLLPPTLPIIQHTKKAAEVAGIVQFSYKIFIKWFYNLLFIQSNKKREELI